MEPSTHRAISHGLCGTPTDLGDGRATVRLITTDEMAVDEQGLVHGGFVFGLADHAAMLAVDHPHVVLGSAQVRFTAPVRAGDEVVSTARVVGTDDRKRIVETEARVDDRQVFKGTFRAYVLDRHVLEG